MIFNMLKFHSNFKQIECLEHFIAEWNQCFSRISLYQFYWACHFRSANFKEFEGILRNFKECSGNLKEFERNYKEIQGI